MGDSPQPRFLWHETQASTIRLTNPKNQIQDLTLFKNDKTKMLATEARENGQCQ